MRKLFLCAAALAAGLAAGCASGSYGAGGGVMFADCYDDYCVGYDELCRPSLYLRTPSTPSVPGCGEVKLAADGRPAPRTAPAPPASSRPPTTTASRRP